MIEYISSTSNTVDFQEIENFEILAKQWWDPKGPFKPLHLLNPARLLFIQQQIQKLYEKPLNKLAPYTGLDILDVGCGGGLLSEPLARCGAYVKGIDAGITAIQVAKHHAKIQDLKIDYKVSTVEECAAQKKIYDIVIALEVIEHVADISNFIKSIEMLVRPQGLLILSTLNRNYKSFGMAILGAEYILRLLPRGTHNWQKFITPAELVRLCRHSNFAVSDLQGIQFKLLSKEFELTKDISVNYIMCLQKF